MPVGNRSHPPEAKSPRGGKHVICEHSRILSVLLFHTLSEVENVLATASDSRYESSQEPKWKFLVPEC